MLALAKKPMSLDEIAEELRALDRKTKLDAYRYGELYVLAKRLLKEEGRGAFGKWCKRLGLHSHTTRASYMAIFRQCEGHPERVAQFGSDKLAFIVGDECPADFRDELFAAGRYDGSKKMLRREARERGITKDRLEERVMRFHKTACEILRDYDEIRVDPPRWLVDLEGWLTWNGTSTQLVHYGPLFDSKFREFKDLEK